MGLQCSFWWTVPINNQLKKQPCIIHDEIITVAGHRNIKYTGVGTELYTAAVHDDTYLVCVCRSLRMTRIGIGVGVCVRVCVYRCLDWPWK